MFVFRRIARALFTSRNDPSEHDDFQSVYEDDFQSTNGNSSYSNHIGDTQVNNDSENVHSTQISNVIPSLDPINIQFSDDRTHVTVPANMPVPITLSIVNNIGIISTLNLNTNVNNGSDSINIPTQNSENDSVQTGLVNQVINQVLRQQSVLNENSDEDVGRDSDEDIVGPNVEALPEYTETDVIQVTNLICSPHNYITDIVQDVINGRWDSEMLGNLDINDAIVLQNLPDVDIDAVQYFLNNVRFNIATYVKPFINNYKKLFEILSTEYDNDEYRGYISGSVVIQTICGKKFFTEDEPQDIDIYLTDRDFPKYSKILKDDMQLFILLKFLIDEEGYENVPTQFSGINSINTYFKLEKGNKKIDIIIDSHNIKSVIADFYATHVMNYFDPIANAIYGVRPFAAAKNISYIADDFLTRYRSDYNVEFLNEFQPIYTRVNRDVFERNNRILTRDRITDEVTITNVNYPDGSSSIDNAEITNTISNLDIDGESNEDSNIENINQDMIENGLDMYRFLKKYSEYYKFKKIEGILKYKKRGYIFKPWYKINEYIQDTEYDFNSHMRRNNIVLSNRYYNDSIVDKAFKKVHWTKCIE